MLAQTSTPQPPAPHGVDPRLASAEAVATSALALVQTYGVWVALHTVQMAVEAREHPDRLDAIRELIGVGPDRLESRAAIAAFDRLDACVRAWTPHYVTAGYANLEAGPGVRGGQA